MSISIGTVASQVFLNDQLCPVALTLQILKAGNVLYQLYPLLLHSESCIRRWHTQTRMKMGELTLREKQAIVVDYRQIIKAVKMNPKRHVCKITNNFQKAWGDAMTIYCPQETLTQNYRCYTARCKPLSSTKNRKARLEFAKKHKGEPGEFWNCVYGPMRQRWTFI